MTNKPPLKAGVCDLCGGELYQRTDDNEATIKSRMKVYEESTQPIIDYYARQQKLKKLDGNAETADLAGSLADMLK
jgi:adenylate kinase